MSVTQSRCIPLTLRYQFNRRYVIKKVVSTYRSLIMKRRCIHTPHFSWAIFPAIISWCMTQTNILKNMERSTTRTHQFPDKITRKCHMVNAINSYWILVVFLVGDLVIFCSNFQFPFFVVVLLCCKSNVSWKQTYFDLILELKLKFCYLPIFLKSTENSILPKMSFTRYLCILFT